MFSPVRTMARQVAEIMARKQMVDEIVSDLPPDQRRVVNLKYQGDKGMIIIAAMMNFSLENIKRLDALALDYLASFILSE